MPAIPSLVLQKIRDWMILNINDLSTYEIHPNVERSDNACVCLGPSVTAANYIVISRFSNPFSFFSISGTKKLYVETADIAAALSLGVLSYDLGVITSKAMIVEGLDLLSVSHVILMKSDASNYVVIDIKRLE